MFEAKEISYYNNDWIAVILLLVLLLLTFVKIVYKEKLLIANTVFLSKKYLLLYFNKEKRNVFNGYQVILFTVQVIVIALLLLFLNFGNQWLHKSLFTLFLTLAGLTLSYFAVRYVFGLFMAFIFNLKSEHSKITYQKISYLNNLALWVLPLLVLAIYTPKYQQLFIQITLIIVLILLILRYGLLMANNKNLIFNNLFYFILYLCTFEIAPLLIILKLTILKQN